MTAPTHVYATLHGSFTGGPWLGEAAQIGLRLVPHEQETAPAKGTEFDLPAQGDVVADMGETTGTHGTLARLWSFRMGSPGIRPNYDDGVQVDVAEDLWTFANAVKAYTSNVFAWTHVKQAAVGSDGKTIKGSSIYTFTAALQGGGSSGIMPPQLAAAVSLRAPIAGRRGRGRIYLPALSAALEPNGTLLTAATSNWRTNMKTLVESLANLPGISDYQLLVSLMSPDSASAVRPSQVRTGNRCDTIQSRRRQVPESYTTLAL